MLLAITASTLPHSKQPDLAPTLPRFAGLDYSRTPSRSVSSRNKILGNHACPDATLLIDEAVRRFGSVQGTALGACAGVGSANEVNIDRERRMR